MKHCLEARTEAVCTAANDWYLSHYPNFEALSQGDQCAVASAMGFDDAILFVATKSPLWGSLAGMSFRIVITSDCPDSEVTAARKIVKHLGL